MTFIILDSLGISLNRDIRYLLSTFRDSPRIVFCGWGRERERESWRAIQLIRMELLNEIALQLLFARLSQRESSYIQYNNGQRNMTKGTKATGVLEADKPMDRRVEKDPFMQQR